MSLRDNVCSSEWESALRLLPQGTLPVCDDLPDVTDECTGIKIVNLVIKQKWGDVLIRSSYYVLPCT